MSDSLAVSAPLVEAAPGRYSPSWVDRAIDWIDRLPFPAVAFYAGLAAVLTGLEGAVLFADGTYPGRIMPWNFVLSLTGVYFLALIHWLDHAALRALAAFRPALTADDASYERLVYELTTLPARPTMGFSGAWCALSLLALLVTPASTFREAATFTSPLATVVQLALWIFIWWTGGAFNYHTVHQLSVVSRILTTHTRIDLFALQPLYAFSPLTAVTSAGYVLTAYAWISAMPNELSSADVVLYAGVLMSNFVLTLITFVWPLWGVHRLLVAEKARWQADLAARMKETILDLQHRVDMGDRADSTQLKDTMEALVVAEATLDKVRTWPWQPGTARGLAGAVLLPIILWLITRLLERLVTF